MYPTAMARMAGNGCVAAGHYQRYQPEYTQLYYIVERYYLRFVARLAQHGKSLPVYIQQEFEDFPKCGRLEHGFLRVRCERCHHEHFVAFSCTRRGFCPCCGRGVWLKAPHSIFFKECSPVPNSHPVVLQSTAPYFLLANLLPGAGLQVVCVCTHCVNAEM